MATITIRNVDDALKERLRIQAATHDRSMEAAARKILDSALNRDLDPTGSDNLGSALHVLFKPFGGVDLENSERDPMREPPRFDEDAPVNITDSNPSALAQVRYQVQRDGTDGPSAIVFDAEMTLAPMWAKFFRTVAHRIIGGRLG